MPIKGEKKNEISVIIPLAGAGKRMLSYGAKCLIDLNNQHTIISRQLELIKNTLSPKEIIIIGGHEAQKVFKHTPENIKKVENELHSETNVLRSIGMGLRVISTDFVCVIYGDLVFSQNAINFPLSRSLLVLDNGGMNEEEVGVTVCDGEVEHLFYDLPKKWGQIGFFAGRELKLLKSIAYNSDKFKLYGFEAINEIIDKGGRFLVHDNPNIKIIDVDSPKDIPLAQKII